MAKKSIIFDGMEYCCVCESPYVQIHHVFYGTANRKLSDQLGLVVPLCQRHHTGSNGVHFNKGLDLYIKMKGQAAYEEKIGSREEFIKIFGKSYL